MEKAVSNIIKVALFYSGVTVSEHAIKCISFKSIQSVNHLKSPKVNKIGNMKKSTQNILKLHLLCPVFPSHLLSPGVFDECDTEVDVLHWSRHNVFLLYDMGIFTALLELLSMEIE